MDREFFRYQDFRMERLIEKKLWFRYPRVSARWEKEYRESPLWNSSTKASRGFLWALSAITGMDDAVSARDLAISCSPIRSVLLITIRKYPRFLFDAGRKLMSTFSDSFWLPTAMKCGIDSNKHFKDLTKKQKEQLLYSTGNVKHTFKYKDGGRTRTKTGFYIGPITGLEKISDDMISHNREQVLRSKEMWLLFGQQTKGNDCGEGAM